MSRNRRRRIGYRPGPQGGSAAPRTGGAGPVTPAPPSVSHPAPQPVATQSSSPAATLGAAPQPQSGPRSLRRDQQRALRAYEWASAATDVLGEYEIAVQSFAAALLRSGFAAAVSVLERSKERPGFHRLLDDLSGWPLAGIEKKPSAEWPAQVRALADITQYMHATRELILLLSWLRRACRALRAEET